MEFTLKQYIPSYKINSDFKPEFLFTVFVPVFNSGHTIHRVFKSLNNQTLKNFEVIIINDGSTDNSNEIIEKLGTTANFSYTYINNPINKHKMGCMIEAIEFSKGFFFITLDADDECTPNALEKMAYHYDVIPEKMKPKVSGVTCCCVDHNGFFVGDKYEQQPFYSNPFEHKIIHQIKGEKWGFTKTFILKSISVNPDVFGRGLIPESYLWMLVSKEGYITKYINEQYRIYYRDTNKSLSSLGYEKKAFGMVVFGVCFLNWYSKDYLYKIPKVFLMRLYSIVKASNYLKYNLKDYLQGIDNFALKSLLVLAWPLKKVFK